MLKRVLGAAVIFLIGGTVLAQDVAQNRPVIHVVTYGDTMYRIAVRYGMTVDEIAAANDIVYTWNLQIGQELVIPGLTAPDSDAVVENPLVAGTPVQHTIQRGETLGSIARQYGVSSELILRANNISDPNLIYYGQVLNIWTPETVDDGANADAAETTTDLNTDTVSPSGSAPLMHQVKNGETLGKIAYYYGVSITDLIAVNGLANPDRINVGALLKIPGRNADPISSTNPDVLAEYAGTHATITEGKQVVVDLSEQRVYAFENGTLVFTALVSTGLPDTPTVLGDYNVYVRLESQTMSGPGYYLPGVQWVQYFYSGYGLHGAYWHDNFGHPMSHGCVNLANADAYWLYRWAAIGTPVHVKA